MAEPARTHDRAATNARRRDEAIARIVERHQTWLSRYLSLLGCPAHDVDDLLQETFVAFLRNEFEVRNDAATARYLRTTARNLFVSGHRRHRSSREVDEADQVWEQRCADDFGDDYFDAVKRCLQELTPRAQRAVIASHVEGQSRREIAAELGLRPEGAKSLLGRAMATLRACIDRRTNA